MILNGIFLYSARQYNVIHARSKNQILGGLNYIFLFYQEFAYYVCVLDRFFYVW